MAIPPDTFNDAVLAELRTLKESERLTIINVENHGVISLDSHPLLQDHNKVIMLINFLPPDAAAKAKPRALTTSRVQRNIRFFTALTQPQAPGTPPACLSPSSRPGKRSSSSPQKPSPLTQSADAAAPAAAPPGKDADSPRPSPALAGAPLATEVLQEIPPPVVDPTPDVPTPDVPAPDEPAVDHPEIAAALPHLQELAGRPTRVVFQTASDFDPERLAAALPRNTPFFLLFHANGRVVGSYHSALPARGVYAVDRAHYLVAFDGAALRRYPLAKTVPSLHVGALFVDTNCGYRIAPDGTVTADERLGHYYAGADARGLLGVAHPARARVDFVVALCCA